MPGARRLLVVPCGRLLLRLLCLLLGQVRLVRQGVEGGGEGHDNAALLPQWLARRPLAGLLLGRERGERRHGRGGGEVLVVRDRYEFWKIYKRIIEAISELVDALRPTLGRLAGQLARVKELRRERARDRLSGLGA